jgi:hypothetical protein
MTETKTAEKPQIYCNYCKRETNHETKGTHEKTWYDHEIEYGESMTYRLYVCMGCEHAVLQVEYTSSEMIDEEGHGYSTVSYHPERSQHELGKKHYTKLKARLAALYEEAIICYNRKAMILCAAGLRALLEGICQDKKIKGNNLKDKIEGLKVLLPNKNIIRNLHHLRFMGNEAVHELAAPKRTELALAISVIEDLLNFLYELDYKAAQLREMRKNKRVKSPKQVKPVSATLTITPNP